MFWISVEHPYVKSQFMGNGIHTVTTIPIYTLVNFLPSVPRMFSVACLEVLRKKNPHISTQKCDWIFHVNYNTYLWEGSTSIRSQNKHFIKLEFPSSPLTLWASNDLNKSRWYERNNSVIRSDWLIQITRWKLGCFSKVGEKIVMIFLAEVQEFI